MTWVDGTSFVYEPWMAQELQITVKWGADCIAVRDENSLSDQYCHHYAHYDAVCEKSCLV